MSEAVQVRHARLRLAYTLMAVALVAASNAACGAEQRERANPSAPRSSGQPPAATARPETWTGDFDALLRRRMIRVLVPYSPTLFYHDHGQARGVIAAAGVELEKFLNTKYRDKRPFTVVMIPTTRDRLLQGLADGEGDVAAGSLTITAARLKKFDFTTPTFKNVDQVFVTGPGAPRLRSLDDLAGQTIYVRRSKSFYDHLLELNERFEHPDPPRRPLPPIKIVLLPDELESEDVLDMVNVGLIQIAVCEDWLADIWSTHLPNVRVRNDLLLREATQLGWAIRHRSPKLKAVLDEFVVSARAKGLFNYVLAGAEANDRHLRNAAGRSEMRKFEATISLFRKYAQRYRFDYLMLAAQGYQESRLDQNAKSRVGAIGIMQLMPATGAEMNVGNIRLPEPNIHAGTKYLAWLMDRYFDDARFDEQNRNLFAFAAYNAGPANISKVRKQATAERVKPDVWFNQVEHVAARMMGQETVKYVRNVFKYYVAYTLAQQTEAERAEALERLKSESNDGARDEEER
jgi:membrane-bound lytic murein transglycosylase MltF